MGERMKEEEDTDRGENELWGHQQRGDGDGSKMLLLQVVLLLVVVVGWSYHFPRHAHLGSHSSHHHST